MPKQQMIVLTMSYKLGGYCLAGIDPNNGSWLRLVTKDGGAVSKRFCSNFDVLDQIEVEVVGSEATEVQPENLLLNENISATIIAKKVPWNFVKSIHPIEQRKSVFGRWLRYENDKEFIIKSGISLTMIEAENLTIVPDKEGRADLNFESLGMKYDKYRITDPKYRNCKESIVIEKAILVLSIGENYPFKKDDGSIIDRYYKFVAAIYPLDV